MAELNPENELVQAVRDQWQKIAALLLYQLKGTGVVRIGVNDIEKFTNLFKGDMPTILMKIEGRGREEEIVLQIVSAKEGKKLADQDRLKRN